MVWGAGNLIWRQWSQFVSKNIIVLREAVHTFLFILHEQILISCLAYVSRPCLCLNPIAEIHGSVRNVASVNTCCKRNTEA